MHLFDTVLITASSEAQAVAFRRLIARRQEHGLYPRELDFEVVADPPGGRVGTGGGTLWALTRLLERRGPDDPVAFLGSQRILLIHAGGESRRLPTYAPEGKLFAPLPLSSSALLPPVVLDAQLGLFFKYPWRRGETVVTTADVYIDFDVASVPEERGPVFGFAKPASLEQGSRHGVFRFDQHREHVVDYYQKAPVDVLAEQRPHRGHRRLRPRHRPGLPRPRGPPCLPLPGRGRRGRRLSGERARGRPRSLRPLPRGADRLPGGAVLRGVLGAGGPGQRAPGSPRAPRLRDLPPLRAREAR